MSLPVLTGFAGVLVAAVATGMLAGRCVRQPGPAIIGWTAATLALTVALAAEAMGFASGFGPATFRAVQLFALLLAPLWLAWGLAELIWPSEAARFGARLVCGALTVIGSVILATDPLTATPFGKSWPLAAQHYQPPSHYALDAAQAVAVIIALTTAGLAATGARNDRHGRATLAGVAAVGVAVLITAGLRFSLPSRSAYPLIGIAAAALVWFGATKLESLPARAGRAGRVSGDGRGDRRPTMAGPDGPPGWLAANSHRGHRDPAGGPHPAGDPGDLGRWPDPGRSSAPREPDWYRGEAGPADPGPQFSAPVPRDRWQAAPAAPAVRPEDRPVPRPYGRILIFTLLDDRVADFDRLAEQTAEEVRTREPDTLVYVIHLVPNAPMQRIFYEIYRDRAAFDAHESQPYMQRFVADRRACVLATNVIELTLKYAKVAPLPNPQAAAPRPLALPPGRTQGVQGGQGAHGVHGVHEVQGAQGPQRPEALEPLPPGPDRRLPSVGGRYGGG